MYHIIGLRYASNSITVNGATAYRKGEYFRQQLGVANGNGPVWTNVTVNKANTASVNGNVFVPKTPEPFTYDADGNLLGDGRWNYSWDAENRLVAMAANTTVGPQISLAFQYDWQGRRILKQVSASGVCTNSTASVYDQWNLIAELNTLNAPAAPTLYRSYLWGLDLSGSLQGAGGVGGLLEINDPTNGVHFAAYDGNGNVACLCSAANGAGSAVYEYGPFGEPIRATGAMARANHFRFSTRYQDDETDLLYYGYRYLNSGAGRWLSRDPVTELTGRPTRRRALVRPRQEADLYLFADNGAVSRYDYIGLQSHYVLQYCGCHCGPVVDDVLQKLYWSMRDKFDKEDKKTQKKGCRALIDIPASTDSWDFTSLKGWNWAGKYRPDHPPQCEDLVAWQRCSTAVTYRGRCVKEDVLNYVFFGIAANLCDAAGIAPIGLGYIDQEIDLLYLRDWGRAGGEDISAKIAAMLDGYDLFTTPPSIPTMGGCLPRTSSALDPGAWPLNPNNWRWEYIFE
jgi:RHS repeat-associated protein